MLSSTAESTRPPSPVTRWGINWLTSAVMRLAGPMRAAPPSALRWELTGAGIESLGPGGPVSREVPRPGAGQLLARVDACGICFSDHLVKDGGWPGLTYPRVPGHEVVGVIDEAGAGVTEWKKGDRVGVGWHGGHDFVCPSCRRGDFVTCANGAITGLTRGTSRPRQQRFPRS